MFCSNCGTKLQDGAKFCHNCGAPVISNTAPAENVIPEAPAQMPEPTFAAPVFTPAEHEIPVSSVPEPVFEPEITEIPEPAFAAPEFMPAEPVVEEAPVFEMPQDAYTGTASPYTSASPFDQNAPVSADAPKEIGGEVPAYSYTYGMPQSSATKTADNSVPAGNPYTAAAPVTQTQGAYTAPAGSKKGSKSEKRKRLIAIVIVFALLAGCWYWFFGRDGKDGGGDHTPVPDPSTIPADTTDDPTQLPEYALALEAFENGDYDTALGLLGFILKEYDDETGEIFQTYKDVCSEKYVNIFETKEYAANEDFVLMVYDLVGDPSSTIADVFYTEWLKSIYLGESGDDFDAVFARAEQYLTEENKNTLSQLHSMTTTLAGMIAENMDAEKRDVCCYALHVQRSMLDIIMGANGGKPLHINVEGYEHSHLIIYKDDSTGYYYAYYGDLDENGKRTGTGTMISSYDSTDEEIHVYWYHCDWAGDAPNGQFLEYYREYDSELNALNTLAWYGTLKEGLYDGDFYEIYEDVTYTCVMSDGKHTMKYGEADNGNIATMIREDGQEGYLWMSPEAFEGTYGVDFY